jgi:hypothetical protein
MEPVIMQHRAGLPPSGAIVGSSHGDCERGNTSTNVAQDQIINDLRQILDRVDALHLGLAGIHLSAAIDAIQKAGVERQAPPQA